MQNRKVTAEDLHTKMVKLSALVEMFEASYIELAESNFAKLDKKEKANREKACAAVYMISDLVADVTEDMDYLCEHMEMCNVIRAAALARAGAGKKED